METPVYRYNMELLQQTISLASSEASRYNYNLHYAIKANSNLKILNAIARRGMGADCVSGNEITAALNAGFLPHKIVFAGVGKTNDEIELAIHARIHCIHVESLQELKLINEISLQMAVQTRVAFRLNPNIDAGTHKYITTGTNINKFGLSEEELSEAIWILPALKSVKFIGFHFHIGSQILDVSKFKQLAQHASRLYQEYNHMGISYMNLGGGLGIDYEKPELNPIPNFKEYFHAFASNLAVGNNVSLHFEPGRSIVGQCGELLTRVLFVKRGNGHPFAVVDAGMNNLIRPALYQAKHSIYCINPSSQENDTYDVVGPICESSDVFANNVELPVLKRDDLLAIRSAGAYGESMSSQYNLRDYTPSIYTQDENLWEVI